MNSFPWIRERKHVRHDAFSLCFEDCACPVQNARNVRQIGLLTGKVRKDHIKASDALDRGFQIEKRFFDQTCHDLSTWAKAATRFMDNDHTPRLARRGRKLLVV